MVKRYNFHGGLTRYENGVMMENIEHSVYLSSLSPEVVFASDYDNLALLCDAALEAKNNVLTNNDGLCEQLSALEKDCNGYLEDRNNAYERIAALEARQSDYSATVSALAAKATAYLKRIAELEAALKLVACNCNGEAGCKSYELYYQLCPASETKVDP